MRIFSWNVNGLRAVLRKGALQEFLEKEKLDVLCLQEIKCRPEQIEIPEGYSIIVNSAERPGYSGTAILFSSHDLFVKNVIRWRAGGTALRANPSVASGIYVFEQTNPNNQCSENSIAIPEGRILTLEFEKFYLVNVYTPNSKPDLSRLELREKSWDPEFLAYLKELEKKKPVITCGDFNAAHEEIDIARPKTNHHSAGFTDEERKGITNLISAGFVDTFRELNPNAARYTWWSHWGKARENNVGWRIDYFFISNSIKPSLKKAEIFENYLGSDHCPIMIEVDDELF